MSAALAERGYPLLVHPNEHDPNLPIYTFWVQFTEEGATSDRDLGLEVLSPIPEDSWLDFELTSSGVDLLLGVPHAHVESGEGWVFGLGAIGYALSLGVAPGQPFAVQMRVSYWTSYEGEHDAQFDWDLVAVEPLSPEEAALRIETWLADFQEYRQAAVQEMAELRKKRLSDVSQMYLATDWYPLRGEDFLHGANGVILKLCSRHTRLELSRKWAWAEIHTIRRDDGNLDRAKADLFSWIAKEMPHVDTQALAFGR